MEEYFEKIIPKDLGDLYSNSIDELLSKINEDLGNKSIDFYYLNSCKEYRELLYIYLEKMGFNYALSKILDINKINNFSDINSEENIKIASILIDCNIISDDKITVEGNALEGIDISYKKYKGFQREYKIIFNNNKFPLKIRGIEFDSNEIISINVTKIKDSIVVKIRIDINPKLDNEYNLLENLLIYTDYKLYQFNIKITCNKDFDSPFKNIEEFLNICSKDIKEGMELFYGGKFEHYLEEINDELSFINYIESKEYGEEDRFNSFLKLVDTDLIHFKDKYNFKNLRKDNLISESVRINPNESIDHESNDSFDSDLIENTDNINQENKNIDLKVRDYKVEKENEINKIYNPDKKDNDNKEGILSKIKSVIKGVFRRGGK